MSEAPDWIDEVISEARQLFGLNEMFQIEVNFTDKPGGSDRNYGFCSPESEIFYAKIELSKDLENDLLGRQVIFHEVLHIVLDEINAIVNTILAMIEDEKVRDAMKQLYRHEVEKVTDRLSRGITENGHR